MTHSIERYGYWAMQWSTAWDPSLSDLLQVAPELVLGKRVAITSCDSGPYTLTVDELTAGWRLAETVAISKEITEAAELPAPGFDEWYVFDVVPSLVPTRNYVNCYSFSPLSECDTTELFWEQIRMTQPLHVLGAGTPHMFFVTRDRDSFERVKKLEHTCTARRKFAD
ncbi:hypothetical protein RCH09_002357 [Actimicrobium sp. GrIS 1.19]|uniref:hypothetical protein n=1 Tax=Actimicrobium sp. GrIS 1.19 TaxID=3071708 RepID=UPI002E0C0C71|nr:hypothetical protein [Actimicrobium sp. GrIS 1.19]